MLGDETTTYYDSSLWNSKWIAPNTPAMNSANEKVGEKGHVFPCGWRYLFTAIPAVRGGNIFTVRVEVPLPLPMAGPLPKTA